MVDEQLPYDAAHGLRCGQAAGEVANEEVGEPVDAEVLPAG